MDSYMLEWSGRLHKVLHWWCQGRIRYPFWRTGVNWFKLDQGWHSVWWVVKSYGVYWREESSSPKGVIPEPCTAGLQSYLIIAYASKKDNDDHQGSQQIEKYSFFQIENTVLVIWWHEIILIMWWLKII